jgi:hypothetical protein
VLIPMGDVEILSDAHLCPLCKVRAVVGEGGCCEHCLQVWEDGHGGKREIVIREMRDAGKGG